MALEYVYLPFTSWFNIYSFKKNNLVRGLHSAASRVNLFILRLKSTFFLFSKEFNFAHLISTDGQSTRIIDKGKCNFFFAVSKTLRLKPKLFRDKWRSIYKVLMRFESRFNSQHTQHNLKTYAKFSSSSNNIQLHQNVLSIFNMIYTFVIVKENETKTMQKVRLDLTIASIGFVFRTNC